MYPLYFCRQKSRSRGGAAGVNETDSVVIIVHLGVGVGRILVGSMDEPVCYTRSNDGE
jgi:hypothetical protein